MFKFLGKLIEIVEDHKFDLNPDELKLEIQNLRTIKLLLYDEIKNRNLVNR